MIVLRWTDGFIVH